MSYDGEVCMDCGFPVLHFVGSFWSAAHDLWQEVIGEHAGILCPPCFTSRAEKLGIHVSWHPKVWHRSEVQENVQ